MGPWLDFLMLALALGAGWFGSVLLIMAGWRPLGLTLGSRRPLARGAHALPQAGPVVNSQAVDSDR